MLIAICALIFGVVTGISIAISIANAGHTKKAQQELRWIDARYRLLKQGLSAIQEPPRVCKFCSTIGGKHYLNCPYMVVSFAVYRAEKL